LGIGDGHNVSIQADSVMDCIQDWNYKPVGTVKNGTSFFAIKEILYNNIAMVIEW
jgi:hypothetical protein